MQVSGYLLEEMLNTLKELVPKLDTAQNKDDELYKNFLKDLQSIVSKYNEKIFGKSQYNKYEGDTDMRTIIDALNQIGTLPLEEEKVKFKSTLDDLKLQVGMRESVDSSHMPELPFKDHRHIGKGQPSRR